MNDPETHLIPLVLDAAIGKRDSICIFGDDYDTPDGKCIGDYIHVNDLADAHVKAYEYLCKENQSNIFNLGKGKSYSVREVIDICKNDTDCDFDVKIEESRKGDPAILIGDSTKNNDELGWTLKYNLKEIVSSAWKWHEKVNGF